MNNTLIFDLDDTLYWNTDDYSYPILKFEKLLLDALGHRAPYIEEIQKSFGQIDKDRVNKINPITNLPYGYSMERFPGSMVECYRQICQQQEIPFNMETAETITQIGYEAFSLDLYKKKGLVKGAAETLTYLKERGDLLILLTKGDKRVQEQKISALKLKNWFDKIFIVPSKTKETFREISAGIRNTTVVWSVGNSFTSDIQPALEAGVKGIYIPYETWESQDEKELLRTPNKDLVVFNVIKEIKDNYEKIF